MLIPRWHRLQLAPEPESIGRRRFLFLGGVALAGTVVGARVFGAPTEAELVECLTLGLRWRIHNTLHGKILLYEPTAAPLTLLTSAIRSGRARHFLPS